MMGNVANSQSKEIAIPVRIEAYKSPVQNLHLSLVVINAESEWQNCYSNNHFIIHE